MATVVSPLLSAPLLFPTRASGKQAVSYYWHNEIQKASAFLAGSGHSELMSRRERLCKVLDCRLNLIKGGQMRRREKARGEVCFHLPANRQCRVGS